MTVIETLAKQSLQQKGIEGLGLTMPVMTPKWIDVSGSDPGLTFQESTLTLQSSSNNWLAPFAGLFYKTDTSASPIKQTLQKADGTMVQGNGIMIQLFPQSILRLKRLLLLKTETENPHTPLRSQGMIIRQVPAFLFVEGDATGATIGSIYAGESLEISGNLSFFDEQGHILHPLYVASMMNALLQFYPALSIDGSPTDQLASIIALQEGSRTLRLVNEKGAPYRGGHLSGITEKNSAAGLFTIDTFTGTDPDLQGEVTRQATSDGFPLEKAQQILLANVTYGRLFEKVPLPKLSIEETDTPNWIHDFFTVLVVDLSSYLTGTGNESFNGTKLEPKPLIRLNQQVIPIPHGNGVLGQIDQVFSDTSDLSLLAAPQFDTKFSLPADPLETQWPDFPEIPSGITPTPDSEPFPSDFKIQLEGNSTASFIEDSSGSQPTDVLLTLRGIPIGAAIRIFNRIFGAEARLQRGDGAGGISLTELTPEDGRNFNGEISLVLKDPLGLIRPDGTVTVPTDPELIFDLMVVRQNKKNKRLFGAITIPLEAGTVPLPPEGPDNRLAAVEFQGICQAPVIGLQHPGLGILDFSSSASTLNSILAYLGEGTPRDAPRQPTMARREILAAAKKSTGWEAVISGGILDRRIHNADQDLGAPGSPGGPENACTGIHSQGLLAYDIGRMAFRRTTSFYERITQIRNEDWEQPTNPDPVPLGTAASDSAGLFAGSLIQSISPFCETPELALLKPLVESQIDSIPETLDDLIDWLVDQIGNLGIDPSGLPGLIGNGLTQLQTTLVNALNGLKDGDPLTENQNERLFNEIKRELSSAIYGRRDTQWALENAIENARNYIYLESPGFSFTQGDSAQNYTLNLIQKLSNKLSQSPGLKLLICIPKSPDFSESYNQWAKSEVKERFDILQSFPGRQVLVFHPIGFPGRPSNISTQTMVVDDVWAMVGSSSFRRRGLAFDGSNDLIFTGYERVHGKCPSLVTLRKQLLAQRLGIDLENTLDSRTIQLNDISATFRMIREMLVAGGLGKIERLWNGRTRGVPFVEPTIHKDLANPEGMEFNSLGASIFTAFSSLET